MRPIFVEGVEHPPLGAVIQFVKWLVRLTRKGAQD